MTRRRTGTWILMSSLKHFVRGGTVSLHHTVCCFPSLALVMPWKDSVFSFPLRPSRLRDLKCTSCSCDYCYLVRISLSKLEGQFVPEIFNIPFVVLHDSDTTSSTTQIPVFLRASPEFIFAIPSSSGRHEHFIKMRYCHATIKKFFRGWRALSTLDLQGSRL